MKKPPKLALIFLEYASGHVDVPDDFAEFEDLLQSAIEVGRNRWPQLDLPDEVFVRHLAERVPAETSEVPLEQVLEELHLDDLYLACACLQGRPRSIPALEHHCVAKLRTYLKLPSSVLDDVCQDVRVHLLMGTAQRGPQLAAYKGRGSLRNWVRVIAVNMLSKEQAARLAETPDENVLAELEQMPDPGPGAELELIKHRFRHEFRQALQESFDALSCQHRSLLRFYFAARLTTTEIGKLFRVDQSTVSRWLKQTREAVYEGTRYRLQERLRLSSREFESLLEAIKSQFDLSLSQLLGEEEEEEVTRDEIPASNLAPREQGESY